MPSFSNIASGIARRRQENEIGWLLIKRQAVIRIFSEALT